MATGLTFKEELALVCLDKQIGRMCRSISSSSSSSTSRRVNFHHSPPLPYRHHRFAPLYPPPPPPVRSAQPLPAFKTQPKIASLHYRTTPSLSFHHSTIPPLHTTADSHHSSSAMDLDLFTASLSQVTRSVYPPSYFVSFVQLPQPLKPPPKPPDYREFAPYSVSLAISELSTLQRQRHSDFSVEFQASTLTRPPEEEAESRETETVTQVFHLFSRNFRATAESIFGSSTRTRRKLKQQRKNSSIARRLSKFAAVKLSQTIISAARKKMKRGMLQRHNSPTSSRSLDSVSSLPRPPENMQMSQRSTVFANSLTQNGKQQVLLSILAAHGPRQEMRKKDIRMTVKWPENGVRFPEKELPRRVNSRRRWKEAAARS